MASIIKTLKTYLTNKTIYPRTVTQAVYDSEGKRLDTILGKTDISAISDGTVTGAIAAVSNKADKNEESIITVESIAKGKNQARVFSTTEAMENWLSDLSNKGVANVGDNLYIVAVDVPDWWISSVLEAPNESGMYYEIAQLETQKVDLTTIENAINSIDSKIGSTDISEIGDGTVTGGLDALNSNLYNAKNPVMLYDISSNSYNANDFLCGNIDMSAYSGFLIYYSDRSGGYQKSSYFTGNMSGMYQALDFTNDNDKHYFAGVQVRGNGLFVEIVGANKPFIWRLYGIPA